VRDAFIQYFHIPNLIPLDSYLISCNRPVATCDQQFMHINPMDNQAITTGSENYAIIVVSLSKVVRRKRVISDEHEELVST
jgi:hypothetical protein